ncbi:hypothetical protein [Deinococcus aluminii]|uniref:Uncharacterized protein n=1 Tax=Deinococcus aluminii TaxID=1656885 RepID=A0ABP9XF44_9DEIO
MTESAENVMDQPEAQNHDRQIEIRLALPAPRVRYEKGKAVKEAGPDMTRVIALIRPQVEGALQRVYGAQTEVRFTVGRASDVRLSGTFPVKVSEVRLRVAEVLEDAFENLEDPGEG